VPPVWQQLHSPARLYRRAGKNSKKRVGRIESRQGDIEPATAQVFLWVILLFFALVTPSLLAVVDDHNPIGVTGVLEGVTTTGGAYNVLNHNATRQIDDIVVPGAIGKYGLKMTRYYNSRSQAYFNLMGPGWSHEYMWLNGSDKVAYPNGNVWDTHCTG